MNLSRVLVTPVLLCTIGLLPNRSVIAQITILESTATEALPPVTAVNQLTDVQPSDWAFQALRSLVEQYNCIVGYPNQTYRGDRALTRHEFAAGLKACLDQIQTLIASTTANLMRQTDVEVIQRLQEDFAAELAPLSGRIDGLEVRTATLVQSQFSTTTKLSGQVVMAASAGGFQGDRIIAPQGALITKTQPNATILYRASFNLNTSFSGTDLLQVRLVTGSDRTTDNAAGFLEPNLGSVLEYSLQGVNDQLSLARFYYTFTPVQNLTITVGSLLSALDFVDKNRYANTSFRDFSTQALVNNFVLAPRPLGAGAAIDWHPGRGAFRLRAAYVASSAAQNLGENQRLTGGGGPEDIRLFPTGGGRGGLFGDPYEGIVELEYAPVRWFTLRLLYGGGMLFGSNFDVFGANVELALSDRVGLFGRYGSASYPNTTLGNITPNYWSAGVVLSDVFKRGALAGFGVAQPLIETVIGNATQTNFEAFYNYPISDRLQITPTVQVITNAGNRNENGAIVTGTIRTVFSF